MWAQWAPANSGTTSNLHGVQLLDSGAGFAVGDAGTILKTTDAGATWAPLSSGTTRALHDVYFFNDTDGLAVGDNGLILRTTDGGATWPGVTSGVRDSLRAVSFGGTNGICGGTSQDILYSTDSGATWHVSQKGFFGGGFFGAQMLSPTLGFVSGQNSIFQGFVGVTVNGGVSWTFHTFYFNGNEGSCNDLFFFDATNGVTSGALLDGTGAIARTTNGAVEWTSTIFPQALQGIDFPTPEAGWTVGFAGTILKSADAGMTFAPQMSGTLSDLFDVRFASDCMTGIAVGQAGTILRTTNGGEMGGLQLVSAASRKGPFDIDLPLSGAPGVECRVANTRHFTLVFTFNHPVISTHGVRTSCGALDASVINPADPHQVLTGYSETGCNGQNITFNIGATQDDQGNTLPSASVTVGLLPGDVNGDGVVDEADVEQTELAVGQPTDDSNFRRDLNVSGQIDEADVRRVRAKVGSMLPQ